MKVLIDVSAGHAVGQAIQDLGHDVVFVRDVDKRMKDVDILSWALSDSRIIVTMDKDFGELVFHNGLPHKGILLLRLEEIKAVERVKITKSIFLKHEQSLPDHFSVYQNGILRIR